MIIEYYACFTDPEKEPYIISKEYYDNKKRIWYPVRCYSEGQPIKTALYLCLTIHHINHYNRSNYTYTLEYIPMDKCKAVFSIREGIYRTSYFFHHRDCPQIDF